MEPIRRIGKGPLPGERQGMPGADAGHDSMRDVGGRVLRRRAPVMQQATAPNIEVVEDSRATSTQERRIRQTAATGGPTRTTGSRIKWSREDNAKVIHAFLRINDCDDKPLPGWRSKLHPEVDKLFPDRHLTEQNVSDRLRAIYCRKLLSQLEIDEIRREVGHTLHNDQMEDEINGPPSQEREHPGRDNPESDQKILQSFQSNYNLFRNSDPLKRPSIPVLSKTKDTRYIITKVNEALAQEVENTQDLDAVHLALYVAAITVVEVNGQKPYIRKNSATKSKEEPAWKVRLTKQIDNLRSKVNTIDEHLKGNKSRKVALKLQPILRTSGIDKTDPEVHQKLVNHKDELRQKLKAKGARLRRYNKTTKRKKQNKQFENSQKRFYRELETKTNEEDAANNVPYDQERFRNFWQDIWSEKTQYNREAPWLQQIENSTAEIQDMTEVVIAENDVRKAITNLPNWKSPGPDNIHNFWLKAFSCLPSAFARAFNNVLQEPRSLPEYLTCGNTFLLYKKGERNDPKNYRPITCLSVVYKLLTATLHSQIYQHCETNNICAEEQKGCMKKTLGCKEQLTIDAAIMNQARVKTRNLNICYIDYSKAFDSVPHEWLKKVLEVYKIHPSIRNLLSYTMTKWETQLYVNQANMGSIKIARGIFQGDTLSPLWFILALNPLSKLLNETHRGYRLELRDNARVSHLMFMDDIKLYAESKVHLQTLISTTKSFSGDIGMAFGLDKCATINIKRGKVEEDAEPIEDFATLGQEETYKYLGISQGRCIDHTRLKQQFKERYRARLTKLLNTSLNARNMITAINAWAIPVLTYSFGILKYTQSDLDELDRLTRRLLTKFRSHHPKAAVERLYLKRNLGGQGLIKIADMCRKQEKNIRKYFQESDKALHQKIVRVDQGYTALKLNERNVNAVPTKPEITWREKAIHGRYPNLLDGENIDKQSSLDWLKVGTLFPETEGFMIAIQDGVIPTRNYEKYILRKEVDDKCRKCRKPGETIDHVIGGCSALADSAYLGRHNQVAKIVHSKLAQKHNLLSNPPPYYKYQPQPVLEDRSHLLYWDRPIITDRTVDYNRPDIVYIDKEQRTGQIIDIACPLTQNLSKVEAEKIRKYENLAVEIKHVWNLTKVEIVPIVISATGVVTKNLKNNIEKLGLPNQLSRPMQRSVILQTCHITRKFMNQPQ